MRPISLSAPALSLALLAGAAPADVVLEPVAELSLPAWATHAGDARLFVVELGGIVRILRDGVVDPAPFLDVTDRFDRVWSIAFPPEFPTLPWVVVHARELDTGDSRISRFSLSPTNPDRALPASEVVLLRIPKDVQLHYGGQVAFGPDGMLWISTGDGTGQNPIGPDPLCLPQYLDTMQGKLLRIDLGDQPGPPVAWTVPADNPFADSPSPAVWALGLRNPWRFSFDRETGDLWLSDVGQNRREEVTLRPAGTPGGENFGWKVMEGTFCATNLSGCPATPACNDPAFVPPTIEYAHGGGRCSVIGGFVYRGTLVPELYGRYLYGDFCSGEIWAARRQGDTWLSELLPVALPGLSSFGEDRRGEVYAMSGSSLLRFGDSAAPAAGTIDFAAPRLEIGEEEGAVVVEVLRAGDGEGAVEVAVAIVGGTATPGVDVGAVRDRLSWGDGDTAPRPLQIPLLDDTSAEPTETLVLELRDPTGGARLGARSTFELTLRDDDACGDGPTSLCLTGERFRVTATYETAEESGTARAEPVTADSGFFWFFGPDNPEIFVKVLDACVAPFDRYWVFLAGLTDVATRVEVLDTLSGESRVYETALGEGFDAVRDTDAFATCP